jgi:hypothetical protein
MLAARPEAAPPEREEPACEIAWARDGVAEIGLCQFGLLLAKGGGEWGGDPPSTQPVRMPGAHILLKLPLLTTLPKVVVLGR